MKIAIVCFTYGGDAALLALNLRALSHLRRAEGDSVEVYVVDDAASPLSAVPGGVHYLRTGFDRCGNLNGVECVRGMLGVFSAVLEETGADWVVKLDTDTVLNDLEWLRSYDPARVAQVGTPHQYAFNSGSCYALSAAGVSAVQSLLADEVMQRRAQKAYFEDRALYALARCSGLHVVRLGAGRNDLTRGILFLDWFDDASAALETLRTPSAVAFKRCVWRRGEEEVAVAHAEAVSRMSAYVDFLTNENNDQ